MEIMEFDSKGRYCESPAYTYMKAEPLSVAMNRQSLYKVMGEGA